MLGLILGLIAGLIKTFPPPTLPRFLLILEDLLSFPFKVDGVPVLTGEVIAEMDGLEVAECSEMADAGVLVGPSLGVLRGANRGVVSADATGRVVSILLSAGSWFIPMLTAGGREKSSIMLVSCIACGCEEMGFGPLWAAFIC